MALTPTAERLLSEVREKGSATALVVLGFYMWATRRK